MCDITNADVPRTNNTKGKKRMSKRIKKTKDIPTRRERFLRHVKTEIENLNGCAVYCPAEFIEKIEGRNLADIITDRICISRGIGVTNLNKDQRYNLKIDNDYENYESAKVINAHEKQVARFAVHMYISIPFEIDIFRRDELEKFISAFYRKGDFDLRQAERRALKFAMSKVKTSIEKNARGRK